ncbi:MMPL family transporter [Streptomyces sp. I05A-00742]|uniref:MMPL family transporter n=1 Tax=Streptomyces sp. I05A-00742 TaxID=2732853 RepID=UPI001488AEBE|nr:MMPL family transporter [Streptomyces sp. I05A-00742]
MARTARAILLSASLVALLLAWAGIAGMDRLTNSGFLPDDARSRHDNAALSARYRAGGADVVLLVDAAAGVDSAGAARAGRLLEERVRRAPGVLATTSYWSSGDPTLRSRDGRTALVAVDLTEGEAAATRAAERLVPPLLGRDGPVEVSATGPAWVSAETMRAARRDLLTGELVAVPLTALVLLFVFRSAVAALIPLLTGVFAVTGTLAGLRLLACFMDVSSYAANITCALGLGLAVDYGLFMVTRFREERAAGAAVPGAVARTRRTAGRTVAVSAGVVALSLCALFVFPFGFLRSVAAAGILVALLSAAATVLLVPAMLTLWGGHVDRGDVFARLRRRTAGDGSGSVPWRRIATAVCRRPLRWTAAALAVLALLSLPCAHAVFAPSDDRALAAGSDLHRAGRRLDSGFSPAPDRVVTVGLPAGTGDGALDAYARRLAALPGAAGVRTATGAYANGGRLPLPAPEAARFGTPAGPLLTVVSRTGRTDDATHRLVRAVRATPAPGGGRALVAGESVRTVDTADSLAGSLPLAGALVAGVTAVLLGRFTRSALIPLKAVAVAAASLSACLGVLVHVFQDGHLRFLLGDFATGGFLDGSLVVFVLVVAYALSVDYEVFLLSRIREAYLATGDNTAAVVRGVETTGRVVTAAALIVVCAMAALASSGVTALKTIGTGLAVGVLVDATLVRGVLVPGLMTLAGRWNWWPSPRPRTAAAPSAPSPPAPPAPPPDPRGS